MKPLVSVVLMFSALLLFPPGAGAQITITQTDIGDNLLNVERMTYFSTYFPYPMVDLGQVAPFEQTFDLSGFPTPDSRDSGSMTHREPTGQPGAAEFPNANLCLPDIWYPDSGAEISQVTYLLLQSDGLYLLGQYSRQYWPPFIDTIIVERYHPMRLVMPLPMTHGTARTAVDTLYSDSTGGDFTVTTTTVACDGWGNLTLPDLSAAEGAGKPLLVSSLRTTETEVYEYFAGGSYVGGDKRVGVRFLTGDGTIASPEQWDTGYAGGVAEISSMTISRPVGPATGVRQTSPAAPGRFTLSQNYPNPFNPSTVIPFTIPATGRVSLRVYDLLGREVATLLDGDVGPGSYEATFDASGLPSGVYIYRIVSGTFTNMKKLNVIK